LRFIGRLIARVTAREITRIARDKSEVKSIIETPTDQILRIVPNAQIDRKIPKYAKAQTVVPDVTIDKSKKLITLKWGTAKKEKSFSEVQRIVIKQESAYDPELSNIGYSFYGIYLKINRDKFFGDRILVAKEREEGAAGSLAGTISQFMDVSVERINDNMPDSS